MSRLNWLMKSEPGEVSFDDAIRAPGSTVAWTGVRNYQARNFMRDQMSVGDRVLFYHSSCPQPGVAGFAEVASVAYPDPTQFDPATPYFDPKSTHETPRWWLVDVRAIRKCRLVALAELRALSGLSKMRVLATGNRLSITPVTDQEYTLIVKMAAKRAPVVAKKT